MSPISKDSNMMEEYDFSKGIRGKYSKRFTEGTNVVVIDPDVAEYFFNTKAINDALRSIIPVIQQNVKRIAEKKH
ncbi:MAG: hypothetical protein PF503_19195 [Desulfobacula sp.]|jgi:hypothetical protein|nr:hypothetical protein [Desulfobacula sp.]